MSLLYIQSIIIALCLSQVLYPSILSSKTVCRRDSLLNIWPNQFFCLCRVVFIKLLFSSTMSKTSWLDRCSVQLIFINLLQIQISNNFSLWMSTFLNVHVSVAYNTVSAPSDCLLLGTVYKFTYLLTYLLTVLQIRVFTILFFNSNSTFPLSNSSHLLNASFPMAVLTGGT